MSKGFNPFGCLLLASTLVANGAQMTDRFADRPMTRAATVQLTGDSTSAGLEPGEIAGMHGGSRDHTIWAGWTAPAKGWVTIDTLGTTFVRPMLAVYTGSSLSRLSPVARAYDPDGTTGPNPASVTFPVSAGATYAVVMDSTSDSAGGDGYATLNIKLAADSTPASVEGEDRFAQRRALVGAEGYGVCNNQFFGQDPFELDTIGGRRRTAWWSWTAPTTGLVRIDTLKSDFQTTLTVLAGETDPNDPFSRLDEVAANDDVPNDDRSMLEFQTEAGRTYQIVVDGDRADAASYGNIILHLSFRENMKPDAIPGSDTFTRRGRLNGGYAMGMANNQFFTVEAFEPARLSGRNKTAWWEWTAPADGLVVLDTKGSEMNTAITVYSGSTFPNMAQLAFNNDVPGETWSGLQFFATRGVAYQIMVDGWRTDASSQGNMVLNLNQQPNAMQPGVTIYPAVEVEVFAKAGLRYQLQGSYDLMEWTDIGESFIGEDQPVRRFDTSRNQAKRFYRFISRTQ